MSARETIMTAEDLELLASSIERGVVQVLAELGGDLGESMESAAVVADGLQPACWAAVALRSRAKYAGKVDS